MGAQRFRTPRGLDEIKKISSWEDLTPFAEVYVSTRRFRLPPEFYRMRKMRSQLAPDGPNQILSVLMGVFQAYSTMWMEGVWEIVRARQSKTKFIVSDNPVTFYCRSMFPSDWLYPNDCNLKQSVRAPCFRLVSIRASSSRICSSPEPKATPTGLRENARYYDQTVKHLGEIQFGRELNQSDVVRINYILKKRATRYIAAAEKEWCIPSGMCPRLTGGNWMTTGSYCRTSGELVHQRNCDGRRRLGVGNG